MENRFRTIIQSSFPTGNDLFSYTYGGNAFHSHDFFAVTAIVQGHQHQLEGTTETVFASSDDQHTHFFTVGTTDQNGHTHTVEGRTGPPIHLPYGGHFHLLTIETNKEDPDAHVHAGKGRTRDLKIENLF